MFRQEGLCPACALAPAAAERIRAFPGRGESKYVAVDRWPKLATHVDVPRGVPIRVTANGLVVEPAVLTAPGR